MPTTPQVNTATIAHTPKMINPFSSWTADEVLRTCEVLAIAAGFIAIAALIGQTIAGRIVNKRQAEEILRLDIQRLKLEKELSPRRLTGEQKSALTRLLTGTWGGVVIVSSVVDTESGDFADDLNEAIKSAGWETQRIPNRTVQSYGVKLGTLEGTLPLEHQTVLDESLIAIGVEHSVTTFREDERQRQSPYIQQGYLYLMIDKKPPIKTTE